MAHLLDTPNIENLVQLNVGENLGDGGHQPQHTGNRDEANMLSKIVLVPKPQRFKLTDRRPLQDFFAEYERYCDKKYGTNTQQWLAKLEDNLGDTAAEACKAINSGRLSFHEVKERLLQWYGERKDTIRNKQVPKFYNAYMKKRESPYLYLLRLEALA